MQSIQVMTSRVLFYDMTNRQNRLGNGKKLTGSYKPQDSIPKTKQVLLKPLKVMSELSLSCLPCVNDKVSVKHGHITT